MPVFGRHEAIEAVARSDARVLLVTGDSGGRRLSTAAVAFARAQLQELAKALGAELLALAAR